jgi:hypothetical protein
MDFTRATDAVRNNSSTGGPSQENPNVLNKSIDAARGFYVMKRMPVPEWIKDGEKFALIGLDVKLESEVSRFDLPRGLTILRDADFVLPTYWRQWLGSLRVEGVAECSLFLLAKSPSVRPEVLDAENQTLTETVGDWFMGLMLESNFATSDALFIASGSRKNGEVDVRQFGPINPPMLTIVNRWTSISESQLRIAACIRESLEVTRQKVASDNWRLLRCINIYRETRCEGNVLDRIHQFSRCIEGLIVPKQGDTKRQFKSRTELFIGPTHHQLMGEIYDIRSDVEHLHENRRLEGYDRAQRIMIAKAEAVCEWVARSCLARILLNPSLMHHFANVVSLEQFWAKDPSERREIWGTPVDSRAALAGFDFDDVSDSDLGSRE